jgi:hypothetical protein
VEVGIHEKYLRNLQNGRLLAFDQDPDAKKNAPDDDRLIFINENFQVSEKFPKLHQGNSCRWYFGRFGEFHPGKLIRQKEAFLPDFRGRWICE